MMEIATGTTAYEQANQAGQALMRSAEKQMSALEEAQALSQMHKRVSRIWFDLLEQLDPPLKTEEYWTAAVAKMSAAYNGAGQPELLNDMLQALMNYLERKSRQQTQ